MDPEEIRQLTLDARDSLERGDDVRALAITDQLVAAAAEDPAVRVLRAQALLSSADPEEALAEARRAVELNEANSHAHRVLGLAAWRAQKLGLAQESLERAVELSAGKPELLAEYAWFMASERGPRLARQAARKAIHAHPQSSTAWAALGLAQYKLHRRGEAEASLRRALELNPNDLYAQSAMVVLLQDQRQDSKAEALADLIREAPGTEEFVESVHEEAKRRRISRMLLERSALPDPLPAAPPRHRATWLVVVAVTIAAVCLLAQPEGAHWIVVFLLVPLFIVWLLVRCLRRLFD